MILASFRYFHQITLTTGNTRDTINIDLDFRGLYQINPDHLLTLKYASINGLRKDAGGGNYQDNMKCRLIGDFNETRNIIATLVSPIFTNQTLEPFNGIAFTRNAPFDAPKGARILMPPTFQIEFSFGTFNQQVNGDNIEVFFTIGYDIELKGTRF